MLLAIGVHTATLAVCLHVLELGIVSAACAYVVTSWCSLLLLVVYLLITRQHEPTWPKWRMADVLSGWRPYLKLALPGTLMLCAEWWAFELTMLMAGGVGDVALGAHALLFQVVAFAFMVPLGLGVAATVRVGTKLGEADASGARTVARTALGLTLVLELTMTLIVLAASSNIAYVFTSSDEIAESVAGVMPLSASFMVFDGLQGVFQGILRGCGKQHWGMAVNLGVWYLAALPTAALMCFVLDFGLVGIWCGLALGTAMACGLYSLIFCRTSWERLENEAAVRVVTGTSATTSELPTTGSVDSAT